MTQPGVGGPAAGRVRLSAGSVFLIWLLCASALIHFDWRAIVALDFRDPDDALRLVEVRAWLAGQSWFDVSQHRIFPPLGAPMHWSRLVDLPIAGLTRFFSLFAAPSVAERLALVAVPLLTLLALFAIVAALTRRMTGRVEAMSVVAAMLATSLGILVQFHPMRIDHHGWQIVLGTLAVFVTLGEKGSPARRAALAGAIMAVALAVAIEGLPLAIVIGGIFGLRYLFRADAASGLVAYLAALSLCAGVLLLVMLGWPAASVIWCDAMSPGYLVPLGVVTLVLAAAWRILPQGALWQRLFCLALAGGAGAATYASFAHQCLAGPFATLDPLVYKLWYLNVGEGLPVWKQTDVNVRTLVPIPGLLGLVGTLLAMRFDAVDRRRAWTELLLLQAATFLLSLFVIRSMGMAHALALPGTAWLFLAAFAAATRQRRAMARVLLAVCCFLLMPIGAEALVSAFLPDAPTHKHAKNADDVGRGACLTYATLRGLDALPETTLFAPLDIGAHLLVYTHHDVVATGHHRNRVGMKTVITAFVSPPAQARAIITATPARYLVYCADENEVGKYATLYPHSLTAMLMVRHAPAWLQPVPMRRGESIRVYRILP